MPFVTGWMGENRFARSPVALYGVVLLCAALAYTVLTRALLACDRDDAPLAAALGRDRKGNLSLALYLAAIALAFVSPAAACGIYVLVALIWLVPDRRMERVMKR